MMQNLVYVAIFAFFCLSFMGLMITFGEIRKLVFLGLMQTAIIMLYVAAGYKIGDFVEPVYSSVASGYVNPVPHVLMLTAIVVGIAVSAVGLAIAIKIKHYQYLESVK